MSGCAGSESVDFMALRSIHFPRQMTYPLPHNDARDHLLALIDTSPVNLSRRTGSDTNRGNLVHFDTTGMLRRDRAKRIRLQEKKDARGNTLKRIADLTLR